MPECPVPSLRRFGRLLVLLALGLAVLPGPGSTACADMAGWRKTLSEKSDPDELFLAIEAARNGKDPEAAVPLLETAIAAPHAHLAVACGEALRAIGPGPAANAEVRKAIAAGAKAKDEAKQENLARALAAWGAPELDETLAQLAAGRRSPELQVEALFASGLIGRTDPQEFPLLKEAVRTAVEKGRTPEIKQAACSAAGWMGLTFAVEELASVVRRANDPLVGLFAVLALQRIGWRQGIGSFLHVLSSGASDDAKRACLKAVVELSGTADVLELLTLSKSGKKDYRDAAVLALARLAWAGRSLDPGVSQAADGKPLPVLPAVLDRLITLVQEDEDWEVRDAARLTLMRIGEPAMEKLREQMSSLVVFGDVDTARTAMELCAHAKTPTIRSPLVKIAVYEDDHTRRMFAARALEGCDPEGAVKQLLTEVHPRPKAKESELQAVRTLGYIRVPAAFEALIGLLEVPDYSAELLREVEFALERLTGHRFGRQKAALWRTWFAGSKDPLRTAQDVNHMGDRRKSREKGLYGLTRETERCVEDGLRFLESHQHRAGWWDGSEKGFMGVVNCQPAYTGLSLLAFLGAGYSASGGKYREVVRRATDFLMADQFYDGSFPVTGGGDDSWIFAYLIGMGAWGLNEAYALSMDAEKAPAGDPLLRRSAQAGVDYLVRAQTPGAGWQYSKRAAQSDTSATSWVLMALKIADLSGLDVPQKAIDGVDSWLERCSFDITGKNEIPADLASDYDYEVGSSQKYRAFTGYFELGTAAQTALRQISMTAVGMTCRFFMGWKRSHPYQIGCANFLKDNLPQWMQGTGIPCYHYYWYYGTLAMYQMGGRYWRAWNDKVSSMYPANQRKSPPELHGSWDPDSWRFGGGRLFSTPVSILSLEAYYRFSPLLGDEVPPVDTNEGAEKKGGAPKPEPKKDDKK